MTPPDLEQTIDAPLQSLSDPAASSDAPSRVAFRPTEPPSIELHGMNEELLRHRLRTAAILLGAGYFAFVFRSIIGYQREPNWLSLTTLVMHVVSIATASLLAVRLCMNCAILRRRLRIAEAILFGCSAIFFLLITLRTLVRSGHTGIVLPFQHVWLLLMFTYALFIPNTGRRAAAAIIPLALAPVLLVWIVPAMNESVYATFHSSPEYTQMYYTTPMLMTFCAAIATWGAERMGALRTEAFTARKLGQYHLGQRIGSGGMGNVYLAEHTLLKRPCAVKLIDASLSADPTVIARFEREVKAMSRLSHWNTVEVFDYGRTEDGTFYYVMEYLPGLSLQKLVELHGPLPPQRVAHFLRQVCAALQEAHGMHLVHRDIKPANIFAAYRGGIHDVAKLLDFGLAKPSTDLHDDTALTQQGSITGSPLYMSPEQATGDSVPDARSDLYSLGAVGYYLLTGQPPFNSDRPMKVIIAHAHETPSPPSHIQDGIDPTLESIVLKCLEKSPANRFQSASELLSALEQCDLPAWGAPEARQWWECHGCPVKKALDDAVLEGNSESLEESMAAVAVG